MGWCIYTRSYSMFLYSERMSASVSIESPFGDALSCFQPDGSPALNWDGWNLQYGGSLRSLLIRQYLHYVYHRVEGEWPSVSYNKIIDHLILAMLVSSLFMIASNQDEWYPSSLFADVSVRAWDIWICASLFFEGDTGHRPCQSGFEREASESP